MAEDLFSKKALPLSAFVLSLADSVRRRRLRRPEADSVSSRRLRRPRAGASPDHPIPFSPSLLIIRSPSSRSFAKKTKYPLVYYLLLCLLPATGFAQTWAWFQTGGGTGADGASALTAAAENGWYAGGQFEGSSVWAGTTLTSAGGKDVFLGRLRESGDWQWTRRLGGQFDDDLTTLAADSAGYFYALGSFKVSLILGPDTLKATLNSKALYLAKFDPEGQVLWARAIQGSMLINAGDLALTEAGHVVAAGSFRGILRAETAELQNNAVSSAFAACFDASGNLLWMKAFGDKATTAGLGLSTAPNGDFFLSGIYTDTLDLDTIRLYANTFDQDIFVSRLNEAGAVLWARRAGGVHDQFHTALESGPDSSLYLTGYFSGVISLSDEISISSANGLPDHFLLKYDFGGTPVWARAFGGPLPDQAEALAVGASGPVVAGFYQGAASWDGWNLPASGTFSGVVAAFTNEGQTRWAYPLPGTASVFVNSLSFAHGDLLAIAGSFAGQAQADGSVFTTNGGFDWLAGRLSSGLTAAINQVNNPEAIRLYPNPATDLVRIDHPDTPVRAVFIYGMNGQLLRSETGPLDSFQVAGLLPGIYLIRLQHENGLFSIHKLVVTM